MNEPITTMQQVTIAAPGSQVIAVLLAGLLMAFSFQLIVVNLQVLGGLIALGIGLATKMESAENVPAALPGDTLSRETLPEETTTSESPPEASPDVSNTISLIAGLGLLSGIILAITPASFLAVKLSRVDRPILGAISGLVLWSAYFLILTWLSSRALDSILQTVLGGVLDGVGQLLGAIARWFRRRPTVTEDQVKKEIRTALADFDLDSRIQTYLTGLPPIRFDLKPIEEMLLPMLALPALQSIAGQQMLDTVDRQQLEQLLQQQTQFSDQEVTQILDQLEPLWSMVRSQVPKQNMAGELVKLLQEMSVSAKEVEDVGVSSHLIVQNDMSVESSEPEPEEEDAEAERSDSSLMGADSSALLGLAGKSDFSEMLLALLDMVDVDSFVDELLNQVDLSEWDVARLWQQFQQLRQRLTGKSLDPLAIIPAELENYLLSAASWELNPTAIAEDLADLFYDSEAEPMEMHRQLNLLNLDKFTQILNQRGDLTPEQVKPLADRLESLRQTAVSQADEALQEEQLNQLGQAFKAEVEALPPESISPEQLNDCLESLLESISSDTILALNAQLDPPTLTRWLQENTQITPEMLSVSAKALQDCVQVRAAQIEARRTEIQTAIDESQAKLTAYLTYTPLDKLTDVGIRQKLQTLVEEMAIDLGDLYQVLPNLDPDPLREILSHRHGLNDERREQMVSYIQACWREQMPQPTSLDSQSFAQRLTATIEEILRSPDVEQLSLEDLKPHLRTLIDDPNLAVNNLVQELNQIDWSPLLKLLMEARFDASQIRELLQWLQGELYATARLPRRWLTRLRDRERRFEKRIHRYLKYNAKNALQPEKMRRDLQKMLQMEVKRTQIIDAVEQTVVGVTQKTLPKLPELPEEDAIATILATRDDMTPSEIEDVSQSLQTTWQEVTEQFKSVQQEAQVALDGLWTKLTTALNNLKLPTVALEQIEQEIDTLLAPLSSSVEQLSDSLSLWLPDSPLLTLRSRIEDLNQKAIGQLVQTRNDLSDTVNTYIQSQLDKVQHEIEQKLMVLEKQALKQLNEIRRAAATAATWLLGIALCSAASSALAGFLAVRGLF